MKCKVIGISKKQTTQNGKDFYVVELQDENKVNKTASFFNLKPEVGKEYDLKFTTSGDYTYANVVKAPSSGGYKKSSGGYGKPEGSYPDKEERAGTQKSIERQVLVRLLFPIIYENAMSRKLERKDIVEMVDFWYNHFVDLFKK